MGRSDLPSDQIGCLNSCTLSFTLHLTFGVNTMPTLDADKIQDLMTYILDFVEHNDYLRIILVNGEEKVIFNLDQTGGSVDEGMYIEPVLREQALRDITRLHFTFQLSDSILCATAQFSKDTGRLELEITNPIPAYLFTEDNVQDPPRPAIAISDFVKSINDIAFSSPSQSLENRFSST